MSRQPTPIGEDQALKLVLHALDSGPKTIQELIELTTLDRTTIKNKIRKGRSMFSPDKRNALIIRLEILPSSFLYVKNPIYATKPDCSIPYDQVERYALAIVKGCRNNIEMMIEKLQELYEKQAYKDQG